jgi:hypothetical protein
LSPCGSTSNNRLRTFTARRHFGHASNVASILSNAALRCSRIAKNLNSQRDRGKSRARGAPYRRNALPFPHMRSAIDVKHLHRDLKRLGVNQTWSWQLAVSVKCAILR